MPSSQLETQIEILNFLEPVEAAQAYWLLLYPASARNHQEFPQEEETFVPFPQGKPQPFDTG